MAKDFIIPLGIRCNSALIVRHTLKIDQPSLVFDWVQMKCKTMEEIILLKSNEIPEYFNNYFSRDFVDKKHPITGDWLPHDFLEDGYSLDDIKNKYIRRTHRFHECIDSDETIKFLTCFGPYESKNTGFMESLMSAIQSRRKKKQNLFISFNAEEKTYRNETRWNYSSPINDWDKIDAEVAGWISEGLKK